MDHEIRGMPASPTAVIVGGFAQAALVVSVVGTALNGRYRASEAAIRIGFGSAVLFVCAHPLRTF